MTHLIAKQAITDLRQAIAEADKQVTYTGNGSAGRGADVKPTGLFFQMPKAEKQEPVAQEMPSNTRYTVCVEGRSQTYWDNMHDAITYAQRAVYSGPTNTTRALDDLKAGRIAEWSYGFSAVRIYPPQNISPPQRQPLTDEEADKVIEQVADMVGGTPYAWDLVPPRSLVRAILKAAHGIKENK